RWRAISRCGSGEGSGGPRLTLWCFFFQAEDGIRDWSVTGVQTCALPIYLRDVARGRLAGARAAGRGPGDDLRGVARPAAGRAGGVGREEGRGEREGLAGRAAVRSK